MTDTIKEAYDFAVRAHWGQMYGSVPYIQHLEEVYTILKKNGSYSEEVLIAGLLHDVLEDTKVTFQMVFDQFGYKVASMVYAVTDEPTKYDKKKLAKKINSEYGLKEDCSRGIDDAKKIIRTDRKRKTYPKILSNEWAIHIKLADRIANVKHSVTAKDSKMIDMYRNEHQEFTRKLKIGAVANCLWKDLEYCITENLA